MTTAFRLLSAMLLIGLASCNSMETSAEYGPGMSFDGMGAKYGWRSTEAPSSEWASLHGAVQQQIEQDLAQRGFQLAPGSPDFLVEYRTSTLYDLGAYTNEVKGLKGRLVIQLSDPQSNQMIWRGSAQTRIAESDTLEVRERRIKEAVRSILSKMDVRRAAG